MFGLSHRKCSSTHSESYTLRTKIATVAASAVNLAIGGIVLVGGVQGTAAVGTAEAPLVPKSVLADHLFGGEDGETAPPAALAGDAAGAAVGAGGVDHGGGTVG